MKLEIEIKQTKPFDNERKKAVVNITYTASVIAHDLREVLKPFGINDQHYNVLRILKGRHPGYACPGEIKEVLIDKRGDLTRLLDKLDKMMLIKRKTNTHNRRKVDVQITQKGLNVLDIISRLITKVGKLMDNLTLTEAKKLNELLDKTRG